VARYVDDATLTSRDLHHSTGRDLALRSVVRGRTLGCGSKMGTSKLCAELVDRRMGERADEAAARGLAPASLTAAELELD